MEKRLFLFVIFAALILLAACGNETGNETQEAGNEEPVNTEESDNIAEQDPADREEPEQESEETTEEAPSTTEGTNGSSEGLQLLENEEVGSYLADSEGMTLYYFTNDESGTSNCTGDCLVNWPAFTAQDFDVPEGFDESDFGTITREDNGEEQVTFKGYPLYYFINDKQEGDVNGEGVNDAWYIVNNETTFSE